jgi:hypothetical protein
VTPATGGDRTGHRGSNRHQLGGEWAGRAALAVAVRPALWGVAVRQGLRLAVPGWWRRWPPVPRADPAYLRFRFQTAFGDGEGGPAPADVVAYLKWCRRFPA